MSAHLDRTYGAAFIGMVIAGVLLGVSCVQTLYYFTTQNDTRRTKLLVTAIIVLDVLHQVLITHTVYTYTVTDWGNPGQLQLIVWSILVEVIITGIIAFIVQSFLTLRIWRLSGRNILISGISVILVVAGLVCHIVYVSKAFHISTLLALGTQVKGLSISVNVVGAACDLLIAATLCTLLNFSRTGFQKSDAIINRLIVFSVNTGLLTSLCALASLISITAAPDTFVYISFYFCLGRLYTNSLLATLNARKILREGSHPDRSTETPSFSLRDFARVARGESISVKVETTNREYYQDTSKNLRGDENREVAMDDASLYRPYNNEDVKKAIC